MNDFWTRMASGIADAWESLGSDTRALCARFLGQQKKSTFNSQKRSPKVRIPEEWLVELQHLISDIGRYVDLTELSPQIEACAVNTLWGLVGQYAKKRLEAELQLPPPQTVVAQLFQQALNMCIDTH